MDNNELYFPIELNDAGDAFIVTNEGTAPTPCVITIIPKVDFITLTITGLSDEPIQVSQLMANQLLVIDGEKRTVEIEGETAFNRYDAWEFPKLQPGVNEVKITNASMAQIEIAFNARYM